MSSSESCHNEARHRTGRSVFVAGVLALLLAACTAQPLYGPSYSGQAVTSALDRITIDQVDTRVGQQVRNKLLFELNDRGIASSPTHRMHLVVTEDESPLGVTPVESAPAYAVIVTATYTIISIEDGEIALRETRRASASYDRVNQVYANVRARRDAENRAAASVANDIRIRLAAAAARGVI
jgi:LPS-assembly lipoprotein